MAEAIYLENIKSPESTPASNGYLRGDGKRREATCVVEGQPTEKDTSNFQYTGNWASSQWWGQHARSLPEANKDALLSMLCGCLKALARSIMDRLQEGHFRLLHVPTKKVTKLTTQQSHAFNRSFP